MADIHLPNPGLDSPNRLIASDRVEGTGVMNTHGVKIGTIVRLMIDKLTGKVAYAVMSFGGFLGIAEEEHTIPWSKLNYDTSLGGYLPTSRKSSFGVLRRSIAIKIMTGGIGTASASFMTFATVPS